MPISATASTPRVTEAAKTGTSASAAQYATRNALKVALRRQILKNAGNFGKTRKGLLVLQCKQQERRREMLEAAISGSTIKMKY